MIYIKRLQESIASVKFTLAQQFVRFGENNIEGPISSPAFLEFQGFVEPEGRWKGRRNSSLENVGRISKTEHRFSGRSTLYSSCRMFMQRCSSYRNRNNAVLPGDKYDLLSGQLLKLCCGDVSFEEDCGFFTLLVIALLQTFQKSRGDFFRPPLIYSVQLIICNSSNHSSSIS